MRCLRLLALAALPLRPLTAQVSTRAPVGVRVRITTSSHRHTTGKVLAYRGDTLLLWRESRADTVRIAPDRIHTLDVSVGKHRRMLKGAALGFLGGAAAGGLIGAAAYSDAPPRCYKDGQEVPCFITLDFGRGFTAAAGGILGGAAGLLTGFLVGTSRVDRWKPVELAPRSSRLPGPDQPGTRVGLALSV